MSLKAALKKIPWVYRANARLKRYELKRDLARLTREYGARAGAAGYRYDAEAAVAEFRRRLLNRRPDWQAKEPGALRIFWVGANRSQDESGYLQALRRLGSVAVFTNREGAYGLWPGNGKDFSAAREANDRCLIQQMEAALAAGGIDILLGQMWAHLISKEALQAVQAMGIPVVNVSMDDRLPVHWTTNAGIRWGSVGLAPGLDLVLTTSSETCLWYGVENCPAVFWPLASDPQTFVPPKDARRDIDVLFIGNRYGVRGEIVEYLRRRGIAVDCYGSGWANGAVDARRNAALSKRARIILGVGTVGHCTDVFTLKLRDFDALLTGALYITHRNPDLQRLFAEGAEIEFYETPEQASDKIAFYLANVAERERIGFAGQEKAIGLHTWDIRLASTFRMLGLLEQVDKDEAGASEGLPSRLLD